MQLLHQSFVFILISSSITLVFSVDKTTITITANTTTTTTTTTTITTPAPKSESRPIKAVYTGVRQSPGFAAVLRCTISDKNVTDINWTKKGSQVKDDYRHVIVQSTNSANAVRSTSLKIKSIESGDYGSYECNAKISGKPYSARVRLLHRKRESSAKARRQTVIKASEQANTTLKCLLPKHATFVGWQKNGIQVKTDETHEVTGSSTGVFRIATLRIVSIKKNDFGTYECTANITGKIESTNITLTEKKKIPVVLASRSGVKEPLEANIVLNCYISKIPSKVTWYKDGTTLKQDKRHKSTKFAKDHKVTAMSLAIENLETEDFGTYECEAIVSGKKHSATIELAQKKNAN